MSLSPFHEVQFPMSIAFGAVGGPETQTDIVELASGHEHRNARWSVSRRRWDLSGGVESYEDLHDLLLFFEARRGALFGFRFRDFCDYQSAAPGVATQPTDQQIGFGDGERTQFQLVKHYGEIARPIHKPVDGSVRLAVDGVPVTSGISIAPESGQVNFLTPPSDGATITAGFAFDCPVRFTTDRFEISLEGFGAGRLVNVGLIELLGDTDV